MYTLPFLITKDSKLIAFQYKIIHHILPTKSSLFRSGITDSDICSLCAAEKQTINLLLYHCTVSKAFWDRFTSWWYQKFKQVVNLNESNILYGWHNNIKNKQALNITLLIAKFHIFATSSCDGNLCFEGFLLRLQDKLDVLKQSYIAQMNEGVVSKETVVLRRWGSSIQKFGFINGVDNVNWPPYRDSKS